MKKQQIYIGLCILLFALLTFTNPNTDKHKEVFIKKVRQSLEHSEQNPFTDAITNVLIANLVESVISVDNYILFSLTKATVNTETNVVGVVALGNVFLLKDIEDKLK